MIGNRLVVLMAEDNKHDVIATKRAWKENDIANDLRIVHDGEDCMEYLLQQGKYRDPGSAPRPGILLLDIKMPKMDGIEVLRRIRSEEKLKTLPVVILTTSKSEEDRMQSYQLGVNAYIKKPVGFDNLAKAIHRINLFWEIVELPVLENGIL